MKSMRLAGLNQDLVKLDKPADVQEFFERVHGAFHEAVNQGKSRSFFLSLGGYIIKLVFSSKKLEEKIFPALEHLAIGEDRPADLTILLWDSATSQVPMPPPPWDMDDYSSRAEIDGFSNGQVLTAFHLGVSALSMLDLQRSLAIYWVQDAEQIPFYESAAPLRIILNWWMGRNRRLFVHAAAVGKPDGGVLITGKSGSGKSTSALACLFSDLYFTSDDYAIVTEEPQPRVFGIYNIAKKDFDDIARIPQAKDAVLNSPNQIHEKAIYKINESYPNKMINEFPLKAILVPQITDQSVTTLEPISAISALTALGPTTILQQPFSGEDILGRLAEIVKSVPAYRLKLGSEINQIPEVISSLLKDYI